ISSVDCRSVTINISIPENLCIVEQPPNSTGEGRKPPSGVTSKKGEKSQVVDSDDRGEDNSEVKSAPQESSVTTVDASRIPSNPKPWSIPPSDLRFALYLAERNENFVCVYVGEVTCILLQDLRPGVQYNIKVCCMYEGLCGTTSESTEFVTLASKPSCPRPPNVFARTKSTLSVRWAVPVDNGAKITSYCLQYATITKGGSFFYEQVDYRNYENDFFLQGTPSFQICYTGTQRFHKLSHLLPATTYMLRVAAINAHGQSPWSDVVSVMTYGLPPSSPDPPRLLKATTHTLHLTWEPQPNSHGSTSAPSKPILRYQLEMQEGEARHHFKKVFDDDATQYLAEGLRRCCLYRFRLAASNVDGISHWSDIVAFRTAPDLPTAPKGLRLRGRVRPFHVNLCWSAPDDDGGMPVSAYRLEILMPQLPTSILRKHATHQQQLQQQHKKEGLHRLHLTADSEEIKSPEIRGPVCWPWVIASSDNNAFACVPPSNYLLQPPTSSIYSLGKVNDVPQLPFRVPSSADPINNIDEESNAAVSSSLCLSESSDTEVTDSACAWYAIYEGRCKEVTVYNLTPGQSFQFRVRASSHRTSVSGQLHTRTTSSSNLVPWGHASTSPLKVTTPVVPPINPPSNLRLFGNPKPTELNFTWDPPASNGGAPILSYELWQSLCDPISGSPIKTTSWPKAPPSVTGITSSESMRDLHAEMEPIPPFSSSVTATGAVAVLSAPGSVTSSPQHQTSIAPHSQLVFAGVGNNCEVRGLHPGQLFAFRLRARNSTGWSEWSEWSTFATAPSPPSALGAPPRVKPTSAISVLVSWGEVEQTNGAPILEYRVEWQPNVAEPSQTCTPPGREHDGELLLLTTETNNVPRSRDPSSCSPSIGISKYSNDGFQLVNFFFTFIVPI
ncbi:unnamed protein product, partial [Taenia asiatica]|uniref:Fibronectin type-III domain-containing protein n=1 Tax=Taenia asiatica TaxID=60517 RepID=A0A0R3VW53_TAEAS